MKKTVISVAVTIAIAIYGYVDTKPDPARSLQQQRGSASQSLQNAYRNRQSDIQVEGSGVVIKILSDDTHGSRHQRFILRLSSGKTVLVAHNIDLAPKITSIRKGDIVEFNGEYEWNAKGGVLHWTHRDPNGSHANGWLKHKGRKYQ